MAEPQVSALKLLMFLAVVSTVVPAACEVEAQREFDAIALEKQAMEMRLKTAPRPARSTRWQVSLGSAGLVPVGLPVRVLVVVSPVVSACNSAKVNSAAAAPPPSAAATAPATPSRPTIATPRYVR